MADYRSWCGSCGNEINFGGHAPDCEGEARVRRAKQERDEAERDAWKTYDGKSDDEILDELIELHGDRIALDEEVARVTRKYEFIRSYMFMERRSWKLDDKFKAMLQERGYLGSWW